MSAPRSGVTLDTLRMAFDTLRAHRMRSGLTVFGVVIGVLVVVVVSSILTGMRRNIIQAVEEYGTNNIFAFHLTTGPQLGPRDRSEFKRKPLKPEDGAAVRELAPAVEDVAHCAFLWIEDRTITYGREKYQRRRPAGGLGQLRRGHEPLAAGGPLPGRGATTSTGAPCW